MRRTDSDRLLLGRRRISRDVRRDRLIFDLALWVAACGLGLLFLRLLDEFFEPGRWARLLYSIPLFWGLFWLKRRSASWSPSPMELARAFGAGDRNRRDLLLSALEFADPRSLPRDGESAALKRETIGAATRLLEEFSPPRPGIPGSRWVVATGLVSVLLWSGLAVADSVRSRVFFERTILLRDALYPRRTTATIREAPSSRKVVRGDDLTIEIDVVGEIPSEVFLSVRDSSGAVERLLRARPGGRGRFRVVIPRVETDLLLAALAGDDDDGVPTVSVEVLDPPRIESLRVRVEAPEYASLEAQTTTDGGISGLCQSEVSIEVETGPATIAGELSFSWGDVLSLERAGENSFRGGFSLLRGGSYRIVLRDREGLSSRNPSREIRILEDHAPDCTLATPGFFGLTVPDAALRFRGRAADDYGLSELVLRLESPGRETTTLACSRPGGERRVHFDFESSLSSIPALEGLSPGESVDVSLVALDTRPGDPGRGSSPPFTLHLISSGEMLRRLLEEIVVVRNRLDRPRSSEDLDADVFQLSQAHEALTSQAVGGELLRKRVAAAVNHLREADGLTDSQDRTAAIRRAHRELEVVGNLAELAVFARGLEEDQEQVSRALSGLAESALQGVRVAGKTPAIRERQRDLLRRALRFGNILEYALARYPRETRPPALEKAKDFLLREQPAAEMQGILVDLDRSRHTRASNRAQTLVLTLEALVRVLEPDEGPAPVPVEDRPSDGGTPLNDRLRELLEDFDSVASEETSQDSGTGPSPEEIEELIRKLDEALDQLSPGKESDGSQETEAKETAEADAEESRAEELAQKLQELKEGLRKKSVDPSVRLQREDFAATRRAIRRLLEEELLREDGVVKRKADRERLGQNLTGETTAEQSGEESQGLLVPRRSRPANAPVRAWAQLPARTPEAILRAGRSSPPIGFEETGRTYSRRLATRPPSRSPDENDRETRPR